MSDKPQLETEIAALSKQAAAAAVQAWEQVERMDLIQLPGNTLVRSLARRFFQAGYAMALTDYLLDTAARLKAAREAGQDKGTERLKI